MNNSQAIKNLYKSNDANKFGSLNTNEHGEYSSIQNTYKSINIPLRSKTILTPVRTREDSPASDKHQPPTSPTSVTSPLLKTKKPITLSSRKITLSNISKKANYPLSHLKNPSRGNKQKTSTFTNKLKKTLTMASLSDTAVVSKPSSTNTEAYNTLNKTATLKSKHGFVSTRAKQDTMMQGTTIFSTVLNSNAMGKSPTGTKARNNNDIAEYQRVEMEFGKALLQRWDVGTISLTDEWKAIMIKQTKYKGDLPFLSNILNKISCRSLQLTSDLGLVNEEISKYLKFIEWLNIAFNLNSYPQSTSIVYIWLCRQSLRATELTLLKKVTTVLSTMLDSILVELLQNPVMLKSVVHTIVQTIVDTKHHVDVEKCGKYLLEELLRSLKQIRLKDLGDGDEGEEKEMQFFDAIINCMTTQNLEIRLWVLQYLDTLYWPLIKNSQSILYQNSLCLLLAMIDNTLKQRIPLKSLQDLKQMFKTVPEHVINPFIFHSLSIMNKYLSSGRELFEPDLMFNLINTVFTMLSFGKWNLNEPDAPGQNHPEERNVQIRIVERSSDQATMTQIIQYTAGLFVRTEKNLHEALLEYIKSFSDLPVVILVYKRMVIDVNVNAQKLLEETFHEFLLALTVYPPKIMSFDLLNAIRALLCYVLYNYETIFYAPLFQCVMSSDTLKITSTLKIISFMTAVLGEIAFWFGLGSVGHVNSISSPSFGDSIGITHSHSAQTNLGLALAVPRPITKTSVPAFTVPLLSILIIGPLEKVNDAMFSGHGIIMLEFVWTLRKLRIASRYGYFSGEIREALKTCLNEIETRIKCFLVQRNVKRVSHRVLLTLILMELRLFSDVTTKPQWFGVVSNWTSKAFENDDADEIEFAAEFERIYRLGEASKEAAKLEMTMEDEDDEDCCFKSRIKVLRKEGIQMRIRYSCLTLLVAIFATLERNDLLDLFELLWGKLESMPQSLQHLASFLIILTTEVAPMASRSLLYNKLYSNYPEEREACINKLNVLLSKRRYFYYQSIPHGYPQCKSQIISDIRVFQNSIKGLILNTPFMLPDLGTDEFFEVKEPTWLTKIKEIAIQIRQSKLNKGEKADIVERKKRLSKNLMLLHRLAVTDVNEPETRNRASYPATLNLSSFLLVDLLAKDSHVCVQESIKGLIGKLIRNDSNLFLRIYLYNYPWATEERQEQLAARLQKVILFRRPMVTSFAHQLLNFQLGHVKWKSSDGFDLDSIAISVSLIAEYIASVQGISLKDLQKGRIFEVLMNCGNFRLEDIEQEKLEEELTFLKVRKSLVKTAQLRISQTLLMIQLMLKNPSDVGFVQRYLTLELTKPRMSQSNLNDFIFDTMPDCQQKFQKMQSLLHNKSSFVKSRQAQIMFQLSLDVRRNWLNFMEILYSLTPRNYSQVTEMALHLNQINNTLLLCYQDEGIFKQIITLYINCASRFRRMFMQQGYQTFLPTLFALYQFLIKHPGDNQRMIASIVFAWQKFYSIHAESFVLQWLSLIVPMVNDEQDSELKNQFIQAILQLSESLSDSIDEDPMGISNKCVNYEKYDLAQREKSILFNTEELVKLVITTIAYDPQSSRSDQFIKFLHNIIPSLVVKESTVMILTTAFPALLSTYAKQTNRLKLGINLGDNLSNGIQRDDSVPVMETGDKQMSNKDMISQRLNILSCLVLFIKLHRPMNSNFQSLFEYKNIMLIIKSIFKDASARNIPLETSDWLPDLVRHCILPIQDEDLMMDVCRMWVKLLHSMLRYQAKGVYSDGIVDAICLFVPRAHPNLIRLIKEKFYVPLLTSPIDPSPVFIHQQTTYLASCANLLVLLHCYQFDVISDIERTRVDPSLEFLDQVIIPYCVKLNDIINYPPFDTSFRLNLDIIRAQTFSRLILYVAKMSSIAGENSVKRDFDRRETIIVTSNLNLPNASRRTTGTVNDTESFEVPIANVAASFAALPNTDQQRNRTNLVKVGYCKFEISMLILKFSIAFGGNQLIKYQPGIWIHIGQYVKHLFSSGSVIRRHLESLWSFLEFIYQTNTPLRRIMKTFTFEQYRYLQNHILGANFFQSRDNSRLNTPAKTRSERPSSVDLTNHLANLRAIKESTVALRPQRPRTASSDESSRRKSLIKSTSARSGEFHVENQQSSSVTPQLRKRMHTDMPARPISHFARDLTSPAIPSIGIIDEESTLPPSPEPPTKTRPRFHSNESKLKLKVLNRSNHGSNEISKQGEDNQSHTPISGSNHLVQSRTANSLETEGESVDSTGLPHNNLTDSLLRRVKKVYETLVDNTASESDSHDAIVSCIKDEWTRLKQNHSDIFISND